MTAIHPQPSASGFLLTSIDGVGHAQLGAAQAAPMLNHHVGSQEHQQQQAMVHLQQQQQQRSTRGASKQRRDQINIEIHRLRDLLPLSDTIKERLFQLQVMSLGCIFIRKHRYHMNLLQNIGAGQVTPKGIDVGKCLRGFMMMVTRSGKILHVSDNASEYLGHSVEEIMCQGDSIYDLVDSRDHTSVQNEISSGPPSAANFPEERVFICRLNLSRTAKRQLQYHKFILIQGRYIGPAEHYQNVTSEYEQPVFATYCQPLINPENAESMANGNTNVFTTHHFLDMKFKDADSMLVELVFHTNSISRACFHLGRRKESMIGTSFYQLLHPTNVPEVSYKHRLICQEKEGSVVALMKVQTNDGDWIWLHSVLTVRPNLTHELNSEGRRIRHVIVCFHQILTELEAVTLQANGWIYNMRHAYPSAFQCQDSPRPEERPMSPASPFNSDFNPSCPNPFSMIKPEFMHDMSQYQMHCDQIKVEIPMKQTPAHLSLITPESSSPESSASLNSVLFTNSLPSTSSDILEDLPKTALPELRDEIDEFFRQVEQSSPSDSSHSHRNSFSGTSNAHPSQIHQNELYKYLGPALFSSEFGTQLPPDQFFFHQGLRHPPVDPAHYNRKRSWAV